MDVEKIARQLSEAFERAGNVRAVFGEPVELGEHTIVPVAVVVARIGHGRGSLGFGRGSGTGGSLRVLPVGYIDGSAHGVRFERIDVPDAVLNDLEDDSDRPLDRIADLVREKLGK